MGDLVWAVKNGDMDSVKTHVSKPEFDVNSELTNGRTALHHAADYGQKEVIEYLISKGANMNLPDKHGITPLLAAIWEQHTDCVRLLVNKGADKTGKAPSGETYLKCAETAEIKALLK